jgi:hypothetical protein
MDATRKLSTILHKMLQQNLLTTHSNGRMLKLPKDECLNQML